MRRAELTGSRASSTRSSTRRRRTTCAAPSSPWPTPGRPPSSRDGTPSSSSSATASWRWSASGWWSPSSNARSRPLSVRAPVAGLVSRLDVSDHDAVTTGQPLVAVVDLSHVRDRGAGPGELRGRDRPRHPGAVTRSGDAEYAARSEHLTRGGGHPGRGIVAFGERSPEGLRQNQRRLHPARPRVEDGRPQGRVAARSSRAGADTRPTSSTEDVAVRRLHPGRGGERGRGRDPGRARGGRHASSSRTPRASRAPSASILRD